MHEADVAGQWLDETAGESPCRVVEPRGIIGSPPAIDRAEGVRTGNASWPAIEIVQPPGPATSPAQGAGP